MTSTAIRDPRIAQGFAALSNIFAPDPSTVMKAALMGAQRQQQLAHAGLYDAQSQQTRQETTAGADLGTFLSGNPDLTDMANRARFAGYTARMGAKGMQAAPAYMTGASTFINPRFQNPNDLSTIMTATGVQKYGDTPTGFTMDQKRLTDNGESENERLLAKDAADREALNMRSKAELENKAQIAREKNQNDMAIAQLPGRAGRGESLATASPATLEKIKTSVVARVAQKYGANPNSVTFDPTLMDKVMGIAVQSYQRTKNAQTAVDDALASLPETPEKGGWFSTTYHFKDAAPNLPSGAGGGGSSGSSGAPSPPPSTGPGANPTPAAAPAAAAPYPDGTVLQHPDGRRGVMRGGKFVMLP